MRKAPPPLRRAHGVSFQVEELESRLLFSADAATLLGLPVSLAAPAPTASPAAAASADAPAVSVSVMQSVVAAPAVTPVTDVRHELVFVDASVPDADKLIQGIQASSTDSKVIEVVVIQAGQDGLATITQTLQQRHDLDAVHVISHGDATGLTLGTSRLDTASLNAHLGEISGWGQALAKGADLLLYGCDLTSSTEGQALVDNLSLLTGADVAASSDLTGAANLGGNWVLEYHHGQIESQVVVDASLASAWDHVLATTTSFQDGTAGYTSTTDTYLALLNPGTNYGASTTLSAGRATTQNGFQTLVKFENIIGSSAGQIPAGSVITNVTLTMYMTSSPTFTNPTFSLYRMLAAWTDSSTYTSMGSGVDGNEYQSTADQTITDAGVKSYTFANNAAMMASVQAWVNDPTSNQGWYLFCDDNSSQASFASSENATVANRPMLSVTYAMPTPPTLDLDANNSSGATGNNYQAAFTEQTPVKIADTDATITAGVNAIGPNLLNMTVTINNPLDGVAESLSATTSGTNITAAYNSGTGVLTLSGSDTAANYQTVLRSITYNNSSDNPNTTSRTISVVASDAYSSTAVATTTLSVTQVNDAPVNSVPGAQTVNNDAALVFSSGNGNLISIGDVDAAGGSMQVSLSVLHGSLSLSGVSGLSFSTGDGTADASMVFTGTVANINAALAGLNYTPSSVYKGAETLTITTSDQGNTGTGGTKTDTDTVAITVTATNVAPTVTITQSSYSATEQVGLNLQGTGMSIADSDAAGGTVKATLSVVSGTLTVTAGSSGATVSGSGTASVTLTGTLAQINALLAGTGGATAVYLQNSDTPPATDTLTLSVNDQGNTGTGGAKTGSANVTINITAVNDAPTASITQSSYSATEQMGLNLHGTGMSIADVDAGSSVVKATLSVVSGTLTVGAGSTGVTVAGSGTASVTLTGTLAQINALLAGTGGATAVYLQNSDTPPATDTLTLSVDDQGNTGTGGAKTGSANVTINITAVNDAPTASITQSSYSATEQVGLNLHGTGMSIADVDAGSSVVKATLSVVSGTLTVGAGSTGVTVAGSGTASVTLTGTVAQINALLAGTGGATAVYLQNSDTPPATDTLTLSVNDQGNTGSGGAKTGSANVTINITAVNDAPVNTVPAAQSVNEDTALVFSSANSNLISISDVDAASGSMQVTLSVLNGTLTLSRTTGLTFTTGDGTADASMVFTGTLANINAALAGMSYTGNANYNGSDTLTILTSDQGNTGSGGAKTDSDTVAITVNAVNDAPVNTVPAAQSVNEDTALIFSSANSNLISISDVDAASGAMQVTLSVVNGTLTLSGITGLTFTTGDGTADASMVFTGTIANINAALAGLSYTGSANYNGSDTLTILTSDQGNTGSGGAKTDSDTVAITVNAVNDAPVNTVPTAQSVNEDTALVFSSANSNLIAISDVDAASGAMQVTLSVVNGTLTLSRTTGLTFTTGDGTTDASMVFTGTLANINAALAGMSYTGNANYNGSDTLTILTSDQGNTGSGGTKTDSDTVAITVNAVNDAPVNTVPAAQSVNEDTALVFSSANSNLISISDVDAASGAMKVTLSVLSGTLTLSGISGLTFTTGDGTADASMVFTGTIANINAALAGLSYTGNANYNGSDTLTILTSDQGNTGSGGAKTDSDTVAITVNAVNDAPVNTVPAAQSVNEDTALVFSSANSNLIAISDVDAASGAMKVTLSVLNGTLTLSGITGLTFTTGDGTADASMVFTGTLANINAALAGLSYTGNANYNGSDTLTILTSDQGNTGSGGAKTDSDTVAITVNAVNDAPVNTVPAAQSVNEDTALVFSSANSNLISISDVDAASGAMKVTLSVVNGTLTLSRTTGLTFTTGDGTTDASMVFTGTMANINAALAGLSYIPNANYNGTDTLTILTSDQGNTGTGGTKTDTDTVTITVNAVNDAPINTVPAAQSVNEDTALVFSSANGNLMAISDVDAASGAMQVTLSALNGTLTLSGISGLTFTTGDGTADASMVFTGTLANINAALAGMSYTGNANYNGSDTLTIVTSDQGNTGSGGTKTDTDTVAITVNAVNDAPTVTITAPSYSATEQVGMNLHGTGLSIADVDAASGSITATLSAVTGFLTVGSGTTGVVVAGSGTSAVTLTGTLAQINALLAGNNGGTVAYLLNSDTPPATDTLTLAVNDQGNTGSGGAKTGSASVTVNITAVNDAPVASITQSSYTATYLTSLTLSGTGISIADMDAASSNVQATLNVSLGMITVVAGSTGVTVGGSGTGSVTLTGTLAQINSLLSGASSSSVKYINNSGTPLASDTLTLDVNDLGNTGTGGAKTDSRNVAIDVLQTAPIGTMIVPGIQQSDINAFYAFNAINNQGRDDSAAGATLTLTGSYGQTADRDGLQSALGLTGGSGDIIGLTTGGALTIAGWVRFDSTGTGESMIDFGDANNAGIGNIVIGRSASTGDLQFLIDTPGNAHSVTATAAITDGQWMHVAATVDATGLMSLYVNGTLVGTTQGTIPVAGVRSHNYVGQSNTAGNSLLDGAVDDLLITNKALTAEQIATIYDQSNGLTVPERSANGTVVGTVLDSSAVGANTVNYSLVNSAGGRFAIDAATGVITVADGSLLKYEQAQSHTITVRAIDSGGEALDTSYVVHLSDFNQAPQGADKTISATEDTAYTFTTADFGFSDNDDNPSNNLLAVKITSLPAVGSLTLDGVAVNAGDFVLASDIAAGKLKFIADANDNGTAYATLGFQVQDDGGTANGGADLDPVMRVLTFDVTAVNDAPLVVIVQPTYSATEQVALVIQGTGLSISDVDAGSSTVQATLSVISGTLSVNAGSTGVVVVGSSTGSVTLTGTLAQINDLLAGNQGATIGYLIDTDTPPSSDTLTLSVNDQGNAGSGGPQTGSDSAVINIDAINDAPINTVPGTQTIDEDEPLVFSSANGNLISVSDADALGGSLMVTLSVANGTLTLSGLNGLTFITGDGTADGSMVFTGTVADINAALNGLVYTPGTNYNGADSLSLTTSDQGNTGTGGVLQDSSSVAIQVDAVNDAPVNNVPAPQSMNEDATLVFSAGHGNLISVSDVDAGSGNLQVSLSVSHGWLSLSGVAGLNFIGGDGVADATMVFTGSVADINAALAGLVYQPNANYNGTDALAIVTSDLGNTGTGGTLVANDTVAIAVNAVNDAPVNTVPDAQSTDEDTNLVFSTAQGNAISIADVDSGSGSLQVTLNVSNGTLTLSGIGGLVFTTGDGSADASMVFTGTLSDINAALEGLLYTPGSNYHGADTLTMVTSDLGNTGSGGVLQASSAVAITVESINDAPVNSVPAAQSVNEDTALVFSSGQGNLISISDVDAGSGNLQVTLGVSHGVLTLSNLAGLSFLTGDGTADASLVFTGTIADINAALAGLKYTPTNDYNGADVLTIATSDLGNTGDGGTLVDTDTVAVTVNAVNDAPVNTVPGAQSVNEDTALVFSASNGNLISIADVDAASGGLQVTLSVAHGSLTLSGLTGLSFVTGDGTADASMVFTGTIADINAALAGLSYTANANYNGTDTLTISTSDLGNTGAGGVLTDTDTVAITVNAVNDAPVNNVPSAQAVNEDTALVFSSGNGNLISVSDVDAGSGSLKVTVSVGQGVLSLSGLTGLLFTVGDGTADGTMTFTGSLSNINAALSGLIYTPGGNYNGTDTLTIVTSDQGNTGSGGALTSTATVGITVNAVNDAPVNSVPPAQSVNEDTALVFSSGHGNAITVSDADAGSGSLQVTISVGQGTLTLSGVAGLLFTVGDGAADGTMTFTGSLSAINAALAGLSYAPTANYHGADTLMIATSDQGNTGSGGTLTDTDTVAITVNAVNDLPTGAVQVSGTAAQGQTLSANNTLADADGLGPITYHWLRNGIDTGSTGTNYFLTESDVGAMMSARAVYTDGDGTIESVTSAATAVVANVNDVPTGTVTITGTPTQGQTLSAGNTLSDPDGLGTITYHWSRNGVDTGSTGGTYLLTEADVGAVMSVRARYTDGHGTAESMDSADTAPVANVNDLPTGSVIISGTPTQGQTLNASNTLADLDGLGTITYHWLRNGVDTGSIGTSYVLADADVGAAITVRATYTDGHGTNEAVNSAPTSAVANVNDPVLGGVTITGNPTQGQTLSASDNITDADGLGPITYHWWRGGVDTGATGASYLLTEADVGSTMSVRATYTDGHGTNETAISTATAPVANVNDLPTGSVTISGTPTQGQILSASNNLADLDGLGAITYHWMRDGVDTGLIGTTYTLHQVDVGGVISVLASYVDGHGTAESVLSGSTATVADANVAPTVGADILVNASPSITLSSAFLLSDAADEDGDALTVRLIGSVSHGQLTVLADGGFLYRAADGFQGTDTFTYVAYDGQAQSTVRLVRITVTDPSAVGGGSTTPAAPAPAPGLPDLGAGTDPVSPSPAPAPVKPVTPTPPAPAPAPIADPVGDGGSSAPGSGGAGGASGGESSPGKGSGQGGKGGSGAHGSSSSSSRTGYGGGFAFRLTAGGTELGINAGNVLLNLAGGFNAGKSLSDQSLNLTLSSVGPHGSSHTASSLHFTESTEDRQVKVEKMVVQTSGAALSIGAVWWAARMSGLLASLMISTPAWRSIDPLPVMGLGDGPRDDEDQESDDPTGMDARADRLFGGHQADRELEGIG